VNEPSRLGRVGLLAPMPSEFSPLVKACGITRGEHGWRGTIGPTELVAGKTGMGTKLATEATERFLDEHAVDHLIVAGIAGGMGTTNVGDVFLPEVAVNKHTGAEYRATAIGDMELRARIVTHDDFDMKPSEHEELVAAGFVAVDMETAAVAAVCDARGVPWSAVRVISDLVGVTPGDVIGLANADGSPNTRAALKYMLTKPWRIPKLVKLGVNSQKAANAAAARVARALRAATS
jgi:adenosylhomocysteine nucleosidase